MLAEKGVYDCDSCQKDTSVATRAGLHCGWMDPREWAKWDLLNPTTQTAEMVRGSYVVDITEGNICPGWFRHQPAVHQGSLAAKAGDKGQILTFFPGNQYVINEAALVAGGAWDEYEACKLEDMKQKG